MIEWERIKSSEMNNKKIDEVTFLCEDTEKSEAKSCVKSNEEMYLDTSNQNEEESIPISEEVKHLDKESELEAIEEEDDIIEV